MVQDSRETGIEIVSQRTIAIEAATDGRYIDTVSGELIPTFVELLEQAGVDLTIYPLDQVVGEPIILVEQYKALPSKFIDGEEFYIYTFVRPAVPGVAKLLAVGGVVADQLALIGDRLPIQVTVYQGHSKSYRYYTLVPPAESR